MNRKLVKASIAIWCVVLVLMVSIFVVFSVRGGMQLLPNGGGFGVFFENSDNFKVVKEETFTQEISNLSVSWISGSIKLLKSGDQSVRVVQLAGDNYPTENYCKVNVNGNKLVIEDTRGKVNFFNFFQRHRSTDLEVYLPEKTFETLNIDTVNSDVQGDALSSGHAKFHTTSGSLNLSGDFDNVVFESVSGEITGNQIKANDIAASSTSGDISITGSTTDFSVSTISGKVNCDGLTAEKLTGSSTSGDISVLGSIPKFTMSSISGRLHLSSSIMPTQAEFSTTSGDISLEIPENSGFTFQFNKVSGSYTCDFPLTTQGETHIYQNGESKISASVVSGDVQIKKN